MDGLFCVLKPRFLVADSSSRILDSLPVHLRTGIKQEAFARGPSPLLSH